MIDDRDDGKAAPAVANHRSTSGSSRPPAPRAFRASVVSMRPVFSDETRPSEFFIQSHFNVCSATENQKCILILMSFPVILQYQDS